MGDVEEEDFWGCVPQHMSIEQYLSLMDDNGLHPTDPRFIAADCEIEQVDSGFTREVAAFGDNSMGFDAPYPLQWGSDPLHFMWGGEMFWRPSPGEDVRPFVVEPVVATTTHPPEALQHGDMDQVDHHFTHHQASPLVSPTYPFINPLTWSDGPPMRVPFGFQ
jgi:hypothetical protein